MSSVKITVERSGELKKALKAKRESASKSLLSMQQIVNDTLRIVKQLTPTDTGATRDGWFVKIVESSPGRKKLIIDHPFNVPGARHPDDGQVVNTTNFNLLMHLEYGGNGRPPAAMVRTAASQARAKMKNLFIKVTK